MERIQSLDLARGFTVLFIPAIHTVMLYSDPSVHLSWLGYLLQFVAEGPGAQLFMTLMGIVFTLKRIHYKQEVLIKAASLLIMGYLLNIIKFIMPLELGLLPEAFIRYLQIVPGWNGLWQLLLLGDILHFAAIAYLVIYFIYRLDNYHLWALGIGICITFASPLLWDYCKEVSWMDYLISLFNGQPPRVFFPLLPWLVYPLLGLWIGYLIRCYKDKAYLLLGKLGALLGVGGYGIHLLLSDVFETSFYRTYPWDTLWHIGIVFATIAFWNWVATTFKANQFFNVLNYCSQNITIIYIIQWILIAWLLPVFGYQTLDITSSMMAILVTSALTFSISGVFSRYTNYQSHF